MFTTLINSKTKEYATVMNGEFYTTDIPKLMNGKLTKELLVNYYRNTHDSALAKKLEEEYDVIVVDVIKDE